MRPEALEKHPAAALFDLPCACQNLRRVTRVVTRIYDQELRKAGLEITQFGLLTALATTGEANQKRLSAGFAMDSTTLTRTLGLLLKQGWVRVEARKRQAGAPVPSYAGRQAENGRGSTVLGAGGTATAERTWRRGWKSMKQTVSRITEAAMAA